MLAVESAPNPIGLIHAIKPVAERIAVTKTRDADLLSRWMLRPSILVALVGRDFGRDKAEAHFRDIMESDAAFFSVHVDGKERGCVIFKRDGECWDMHLCLATFFTHTRTAVAKAIEQLACDGPVQVTARYSSVHRAVERLLNDLGFDSGNIDGAWRNRSLTLTHA